jgi:hypothetical protein
VREWMKHLLIVYVIVKQKKFEGMKLKKNSFEFTVKKLVWLLNALPSIYEGRIVLL